MRCWRPVPSPFTTKRPTRPPRIWYRPAPRPRRTDPSTCRLPHRPRGPSSQRRATPTLGGHLRGGVANPMMLITAVVEPSRVEQIETALRLFEVPGLTVSEVQVASRAGRVEVYRGRRWVATMVPRVRLEILAGDDDINDLVRVIVRAAGGGDGYLWVSRVDYLIPIRTGDTGSAGR